MPLSSRHWRLNFKLSDTVLNHNYSCNLSWLFATFGWLFVLPGPCLHIVHSYNKISKLHSVSVCCLRNWYCIVALLQELPCHGFYMCRDFASVLLQLSVCWLTFVSSLLSWSEVECIDYITDSLFVLKVLLCTSGVSLTLVEACKFAKSLGNCLTVFNCLSLMLPTILVFKRCSADVVLQ